MLIRSFIFTTIIGFYLVIAGIAQASNAVSSGNGEIQITIEVENTVTESRSVDSRAGVSDVQVVYKESDADVVEDEEFKDVLVEAIDELCSKEVIDASSKYYDSEARDEACEGDVQIVVSGAESEEVEKRASVQQFTDPNQIKLDSTNADVDIKDVDSAERRKSTEVVYLNRPINTVSKASSENENEVNFALKNQKVISVTFKVLTPATSIAHDSDFDL